MVGDKILIRTAGVGVRCMDCGVPVRFHGTLQTVTGTEDKYYYFTAGNGSWGVCVMCICPVDLTVYHEIVDCHGCGCGYSRIVGGPSVCTTHPDRMQEVRP